MKRIGAVLLAFLLVMTIPAYAEDTLTEVAEMAEGEIPGTEAAEENGSAEAGVPVPEWADVKLNSRGFTDAGEYVFEDEENGHWMYVNQTIRVVIERTYEKLPKAKKGDPEQAFYCFTANIWCDVEAGELPTILDANPSAPRTDKKFIKDIGAEHKAVFATSTDYYTYRVGRKKEDKNYHIGIEIRNGEVYYDDPNPKVPNMPNYEVIALYRDGSAECNLSKDKGAKAYLADGAWQAFTFGPCLVRDGQVTEYVIKKGNRKNNPRMAIGVAEPGHYIVVLCEGRLAKSKDRLKSTGVIMENLANLMVDRGCTIAMNMDGGETAVFAFMGKQLNRVVKTDPNGRKSVEALGFGTWGENRTEEVR